MATAEQIARCMEAKLIAGLAPVHTFSITIETAGEPWKQRFACLRKPQSTELILVLVRSNGRGYRGLGQAAFPTADSAERWARNRVLCNGPFDV